MKFKRRARTGWKHLSHRRFRGYPIATLAWYGPNDQFASKVAVGIVDKEDGEPVAMQRWFTTDHDIRYDEGIAQEISAFVEGHGAKSVASVDRIIGCPHEEGIDYPDGEVCPQCPFWAHRDRWTGDIVH